MAAKASVTVDVAEVKRVYEEAVAPPKITGATIIHRSQGTTHVTLTASQPVLSAASSRSWMSQIVVTEENAAGVGFPTAFDGKGIMLRSTSPSGKHAVVFRSDKIDSSKSPKYVAEIWARNRLIKELDVSSSHGQVYSSDHTFGGLSWSPTEDMILYTAEAKVPSRAGWFSTSKTDKIDGEQFAWRESWGEQHTDVVEPRLYLLSISDMSSPKPAICDESFLVGRSLGHPIWSPDGLGFVFTAWPHLDRKLGIVYCTNRQSDIYYYSTVNKSSLVSPKVLVSNPEMSARSPSFSPNGTTLVWLSTPVGGAHRSGCCLRSAKWDVEGNKIGIATDVVPISEDPMEAGLSIERIQDRCWISETKIITATPRRSKIALVLIDIESRTLEWLEEPMPGSWTMLDAVPRTDDCPGQILAAFSSPTTSQSLHLGTVSETGWFASSGVVWKQIYGESPNPPDKCRWDVLTFNTIPVPYEAILLRPKDSANSPTPLVVMPHGGPHSVDTVSYNTYKKAFVSLGFAVLGINYRGSLGFSDAGITSLPGRIGTQDVNDVNEAVSLAISKGGIDGNKIVVFGGSHGGFLSAHLTAQFPDRYKCAVIRNPVIDISAMVSVTDIPDWCYYEAGIPYTQDDRARGAIPTAVFEKMRNVSPISLVNNVIAPTMILIGLKDQRVPVHQGWLWHNALRSAGKESRVYVYPDDHHALSGVDCAADVFVNAACWFTHHLSGTAEPFRQQGVFSEVPQ